MAYHESGLTDAELAEIARRADDATAGPWQSWVEGRDGTSGDDFIRTGGTDRESPDMYVTLSYWKEPPSSVPAGANDLDFIAAARQDVPRLVAEIRRSSGALGEHPDAGLTDAELDEIVRRANEATSAPWEASVESRGGLGGESFIRTGGVDDSSPDMYVTLSYWKGPPSSVPAGANDFDFIAAARQDVPRLVAEIRGLRALLEAHR